MRWTINLAVLALVVVSLGCTPKTRIVSSRTPVLRVGVSPDAPPFVFKREHELVGIEIDLARELARDLHTTTDFVELPFEELIPALLDNRIDVIMSGLTITRARSFRVAFGDPYFRTGIVAMSRRNEKDKYRVAGAVNRVSGRVGFRKGSTAERYAREVLREATPSPLESAENAIAELKQGRIEVFLADAPVVAYLVSENEADLAMTETPLTDDALAWAFRPNEVALRSAANRALARWRAQGRLEEILARWLPGWPGLRGLSGSAGGTLRE